MEMIQGLSASQAIDRIRRVQADPVFHIEQVQGVSSLEEYQRRVCRALVEHDRVAVSACHDVGKSFICSKLVLWFLSSFPHAKIITTAPTFNQVKNILWSEIRSSHKRSKTPLGGQMNLTEWKIDDDWFAIGFSPQKNAEIGEGQGTASSFQGFHARYILVVFDEATGIPKQVWDMAEGLLTSAHVKFVAIGNPTSKSSEFYKCFTSPLWEKVKLSCFDSPNLIANGITSLEILREELDRLKELPESEQREELKKYKVVQPYLLTAQWVMGSAIKWGIDHPLFQSKVLGNFPDSDDRAIIPLGLVERAQYREVKPGDTDHSYIGVDVARFGSDKTVITHIQGLKAHPPQTLIKRATTEVTGAVVKLISDLVHKEGVVVVDATGIGSGVIDELRQAQSEGAIPWGFTIREVHFGATPYFEEESELIQEECAKKYLNLKARIFVELSEALAKNLALSDDSVYLEELPDVFYRFDTKGRYVIESKDDFKKRTGRPSPDYADSLALANFGRSMGAIAEFPDSLLNDNGQAKTIAPGLGNAPLW